MKESPKRPVGLSVAGNGTRVTRNAEKVCNKWTISGTRAATGQMPVTNFHVVTSIVFLPPNFNLLKGFSGILVGFNQLNYLIGLRETPWGGGGLVIDQITSQSQHSRVSQSETEENTRKG